MSKELDASYEKFRQSERNQAREQIAIRQDELAAERVHHIGCVCETCSATYVRDAWDPRMGEK